MKLTAFIDGAARGNPGKSGIGIAIFDGQGRCQAEHFAFLGITTNNVAEYSALIACLRLVMSRFAHCSELLINSDSELLVRQMNGVYRVRNKKLQRFHREVRQLLDSAPFRFSISYIPRELNATADSLANRGIDEHEV
ncbi:MAG: ribonuclease HI family protein [Bacteroidota bacterium]